ncbi:unnamed protein product [Colias eurytheme]|nr:unnamed protein product [Colias eurytheme]
MSNCSANSDIFYSASSSSSSNENSFCSTSFPSLEKILNYPRKCIFYLQAHNLYGGFQYLHAQKRFSVQKTTNFG